MHTHCDLFMSVQFVMCVQGLIQPPKSVCMVCLCVCVCVGVVSVVCGCAFVPCFHGLGVCGSVVVVYTLASCL